MKTLRKAILSVVALALVWSSATAETKTAETKAPPPPPSTVAGAPRNPAPVAANIDRLIEERLKEAKVPLSPQADDAEFIRRLGLDVTGRIPTAERVVAFLKDTDPNKRAKLIDEFLADPAYGEHFAIIWYHRIVKPDDDNRAALAGNKLQGWLTEQFNHNPGWHKTATDILTATGDRDANPATTFWLNHIGDKAGQPEPNKVTGAASKLFLGVRLECTECHNHPFSTLKQTDFWSTAAFFAQTHSDHASKKDLKANETPAIREGGAAVKGNKKNAEDGKPAPFGEITIPFSKGTVAKATFLGGEAPYLVGQTTLRPVFASWLTSTKNPYFARAAVNKMWANFFGRGIVNPIDDMREESRNSHPQVLTMLSEEFAASSFDLKHLIRCICNSKTYQRSSKPLPENKDEDELYGRMPPKVMSADMLFDSLAIALNQKVDEKEAKPAGKGPRRIAGGPREQFRKFFHAEADDDSGVVEDYTHGIPQVLKMMNARQINDTSVTVAKVMKENDTPEKVVEGLYLTALARRPTEAEMKRVLAYLNAEKDTAKGYGDVLWALLNTSEFLFNH